jgi:hypothetical protein
MRAIIKKTEAVGAPNRGIKFTISLEAQGTENYKVIGYSVTIQLCGVDIGSQFSFRTLELKSNINVDGIEVEFRLPPYLLHSIESQRGGGDVPVSPFITVLTINSAPQGNIGVGSFQAFNPGGQDPPYKISQLDWAKHLNEMGASTYAVLEIPLATGPVASSSESAIKRTEEARALLVEGKTDQVVTACRKALEAVNPVVSVTKGATPGPPFERMESTLASKVDIGSPGQSGKDPKSQRIDDLRAALFTMLHVGPHDGYQVFPEDARALFLLTSSLVRYYADLTARP